MQRQNEGLSSSGAALGFAYNISTTTSIFFFSPLGKLGNDCILNQRLISHRQFISKVIFLPQPLFFGDGSQLVRILFKMSIKSVGHTIAKVRWNFWNESGWIVFSFVLSFFFFFPDVDHLQSLHWASQYCFCFMFWLFDHEACGILSHWQGIKPTPPALEGKVLTTGWAGNAPDSGFYVTYILGP